MKLERVKYHIGKFYVEYVERIPYINWFNPFMTVYLNFRSFPLRQAWKFPVLVYGRPRIYSLYGRMECVDVCKPGMIKFNKTNVGMPCHSGGNSIINNWGLIRFHGDANINTANKISIWQNGVLDIGEDVKISIYCNIVASCSVKIGNHTRIAHRSQIIDTNNHFIADFNKNKIYKLSRPIQIGDYCWVCNSSSITAGAIIPNKVIVSSNSVVGKDMSNIPEESIIGGQPAELISTGKRRVESRKLELEMYKYFKNHPEENAFPLIPPYDHNICDRD